MKDNNKKAFPSTDAIQEKVKCNKCNGSGVIPRQFGYEKCSKCEGTGTITTLYSPDEVECAKCKKIFLPERTELLYNRSGDIVGSFCEDCLEEVKGE